MSEIREKEGPRYKFQDQLFWAVNGRIAIEDQRDGNYKTMSAPEFFARAMGFNESVRKVGHKMYPDERDEMAGLVIAMCHCVRDARSQGDPSDPEAMRQVSRENRTIQGSMSDVNSDARLRHAADAGKKAYFLPQVAGGVTIKTDTFKSFRL